MKSMKRMLAMLLCVVMVVGLVPVSTFAADTTVDYLFLATDRHASTSVIGNIINNMETYIGENELDYLGLGGDMVGSGNTHPEYSSSEVLSEATGATSSLSAANVDIVAGVHDTNVDDDAGIVLPYQGGGAQIYEGDRFYVYGVEEYCISDDSNSNNWSSEAQKFVDWANGETINKSKVIIVLSHYPLHANRDDNDGAYYWHQALNTVATGNVSGGEVTRNVFFFHGHNHTVDTNEYVYDVGESLEIQNGSSSTTEKIFYTYATAGYLNQNKKATLMTITDDTVTLTKYTTSGSGTSMTSVERVETTTLTSLTVSGTNSYVEGDTLALTVTANYSDGTTKNVTSEATLTGYDMSTAGNYTVTASWGGLTAEYAITVSAPLLNSIAITTEPAKLVYDQGDELDTTGMVVTGYYSNGTSAEITGWYVSNVDMTTAGEKTVTVNYVADGLTFKDTYTITVNQAIADDAVLEKIEIITDPNTVDYLVSGSFDITGMVVEATFSDGTVKTLAYGPLNNGDGYTMENFNMYVQMDYEVTVSYTYKEVTCTDTFFINVWEEKWTDEATDVTVQVYDTGCTNTTVTVNTDNETVAAAVAQLVTTYVSYDIEVEGYVDGNQEATVTLPIPDGVTNPVVYYVSDDGLTVENMNATVSGSNVVFETDHFSTYVVGETTEIEMPAPGTAYVEETVGSTTTKTVYVLTSSISSGNEYLIVNGNSAGDGYYALANNSGSVGATGVTIKSDDTIGTYIELEDATDELWTTSGSNSTTLKNGSYYLRYNNGLGLSTRNSTTWTYSSNRLYYASSSSGGGKPGQSSSSTSYYLRYSNGWSTSTSSANVYFYIPTEVEVETTTTVQGTYSIAGEKDEYRQVVEEGTTLDINSILTFSGDGSTQVEPTGVTYSIVSVDANGNTVNGDPLGIIESLDASTGEITFSGNIGKALIKVSYTGTTAAGEAFTVDNYITVYASEPYYAIEITDGTKPIYAEDGTTVTGYEDAGSTIALKGITADQTYDLNHVLTYYGPNGAENSTASVTWSSSDESIATVDENGTVKLTGVGGQTTITVSYKLADGSTIEDTVKITASKSNYYTPADGGENFPAYPNEGAVRFDKTASAVGNFSQTGIAQVELSMTGVPYTTGAGIDVVLMLDITGSMKDVENSDYTSSDEEYYTRIYSTIQAAKAFARTIVLNEDGTYNTNRIGIYSFNSGGTYTLHELSAITDIEKLEGEIDTFVDDYATGGTPYDDGLALVKSTLDTARTDGIGNERDQFAVFMTDGCPTSYKGTSTEFSSASSIQGMFTGTNYNTRDTDYEYEDYSTTMKAAGVTVYTVGLGLNNTNSAWSSASATQCLNAASILLNDISGPAYESAQPDALSSSTLSKKDSYFFSIDDADAAANMANIFAGIAQSILEAATDVIVTDKIADDYTMVFDIPENNTSISNALPENQEFYIEVKEYALDADHERTTSTSLCKIYLGVSNGSYYAASDASGTAYATPVFEEVAIGTKYYWTTTETADTVSVTVDGTTYYFVAAGNGTHNMTSGAYADGTVGSDNMSQDVVIATPYFVYDASTRMLVWTAEKLSGTELALSYFLYLEDSATKVGQDGEIDAKTYPTNDYAYLGYTNYKGNSCYQVFPVPQMTWNGAQVTYVFYLVNQQGQPVNQYGQVVDFANAVFVTAPVTQSVVWNQEESEGYASLDVNLVAGNLPVDYQVYDPQAFYDLHVYETESGALAGTNRFTIGGASSGLTSYETTKVYNTKAGDKYSAYGTYTSQAFSSTSSTVLKDFDFANTTVAFAVTWSAHLVSDTVVVDYGVPVAIEVLANDVVAAKLNSVRATGYASMYAMNTGVADSGFAAVESLTLSNGDLVVPYGDAIYYVQRDMQFNEPATFYYDALVTYYNQSVKTEGYIYSQVTVIPATTIYYEDTFVTYGGNAEWTAETATANAVQGTDRPGVGNLNDANNIYGYDSVNNEVSDFSLGAAHKVHVGTGTYGTATFNFIGTGFDVIGVTSNTTGTIAVQVVNAAGVTVEAKIVDTYFGYIYEGRDVVYKLCTGSDDTELIWVRGDVLDTAASTITALPATDEYEVGDTVTIKEMIWTSTPDVDNSIYQVPVIQVENLPYGTYSVTITATYAPVFDHTTADGYDLYLDAIRVYNPAGTQYGTDDSADGTTGNLIDSTIQDAYIADGEAWPQYYEIRNLLLTASEFNADQDAILEGVMFIDGDTAVKIDQLSDYTEYGPNNEVYLAPGQSVAFTLADYLATNVKNVHIGLRRIDGASAAYTFANIAADGTTSRSATKTITSGTDMYYDLTAWKDEIIVITNSGDDGALAISNVKLGFAEEPAAAASAAVYMTRRSAALVLTALNATQVEEEEVPETTVPETPETEATEPAVPETTAPSTPEQNKPETEQPEVKPETPEQGEQEKPDAPEQNKPETDEPVEDEVITDGAIEEEITEQLGFWARLWNAIKNAFKQLLSWFGF